TNRDDLRAAESFQHAAMRDGGARVSGGDGRRLPEPGGGIRGDCGRTIAVAGGVIPRPEEREARRYEAADQRGGGDGKGNGEGTGGVAAIADCGFEKESGRQSTDWELLGGVIILVGFPGLF